MTPRPPEKKVLLLSQGSWIEDKISRFSIEEFHFDVLKSEFFSLAGAGAENVIRGANLAAVMDMLQSGGYDAVMSDAVDILILRYVSRKQGIPEIPSIAITLDPLFEKYEEIGALLGGGENPAHSIALAPDVFWFYPTNEYLGRFDDYGISPDHLAYFPSCVFFQTLMNSRATSHLENVPPERHPTSRLVAGKILAAGNFNRDYPTFAEACSGLREEACLIADLDTVFKTVAPDRRRLLESALGGAPNVRVCDPVPLDVYIDCLRNAGIVVVPLERDLFTSGHLTTAAAQRLGRPVVAADFAASRDFILHGRTGLLYEPGNPASLREQIEKLLDHPALAAELGESGRAWEAKLSSDARATLLETLRKATG